MLRSKHLNRTLCLSPSAWIVSGLILAFNLSIPSFGQVFYPKKDLIFTQVIAADGFESVISVTNRGPSDYLGIMFFFKGPSGEVWNPSVNNEQLTDGWLEVEIPFKETRIYRVSGSGLAVGYCFIYADDLEVDNNLEGNLTYYSTNTGSILDAVGVPQSREFLVTSLPFSGFQDVGLSLAVPPRGGDNDRSVDIYLFDEDGTQVSHCQIQVSYGGHYAKYLRELPWDTPIGAFGPVGRVDIRSDRLISGIAMTISQGDTGGAQISTLPLSGTPLYYTLNAEDEDENVYIGKVSLWIEGFFVNGYMVLESVNGENLTPSQTQTWKVTGQLINGEMKLAYPCFLGDMAIVPEVSLFILIPSFTPSSSVLNGTWSADLVTMPGSTPVLGTATFTMID